MRTSATRSALLLAAAAALASAAPLAAQQDSTAHASPAHPRRSPRDPFQPCPGQDSAMALIASRPPVRRRPQGMGMVTRTRIEAVPTTGGLPAPMSSSAHRGRGTPEDLQLQLQVDAAGTVIDVQVLRSSGEADTDQGFVEAARVQRFDPATESAFPVPGCAIQTLHTRG